MNYSLTLTNWVARIGAGDSMAMERVFNRYFDQLVRLAVQKMHGLNQVSRSGEDIALSAIKSLYLGIRKDQIQLDTEEDLWGCLFCITVRKAVAERRWEYAAKRGAGRRVFSGDQELDDDGNELFDTIAGNEPSPELASQMAESADELLSLFDEQSTQYQILSMKLQGLSVQEIGEKLNLMPRTVFWHLEKIRERWEFFKGMEFLTENILQGMSIPRVAKAMEKEEEFIRNFLDKILLFWEQKSSKQECDLLRMIWEKPDDFEALLEHRNLEAVKLEKQLGKIGDQWLRLGKTEWKKDLSKFWAGKNK